MLINTRRDSVASNSPSMPTYYHWPVQYRNDQLCLMEVHEQYLRIIGNPWKNRRKQMKGREDRRAWSLPKWTFHQSGVNRATGRWRRYRLLRIREVNRIHHGSHCPDHNRNHRFQPHGSRKPRKTMREMSKRHGICLWMGWAPKQLREKQMTPPIIRAASNLTRFRTNLAAMTDRANGWRWRGGRQDQWTHDGMVVTSMIGQIHSSDRWNIVSNYCQDTSVKSQAFIDLSYRRDDSHCNRYSMPNATRWSLLRTPLWYSVLWEWCHG